MAEIIDGLKIVVQKMGSVDTEELLKAAALLAEQDCVVMLGSETGKLVAAAGRSLNFLANIKFLIIFWQARF